jgi:hypothetical protein
VDGDPGQAVAVRLALARVDPGAELDADRPHRVHGRAGAADRPCRPVETSEEPVAGRVELVSTVSRELAPYEGVVLVEQVAPTAVAEQRGAFGRPDNVGEQDRGEHTIHLGRPACPRRELLDAGDHRVGVSRPRPVVVPRQLDKGRLRDPLCEVRAVTRGDEQIVPAVEHERRDADAGQDRPDVDLGVHPQQPHGHARARRESQQTREPAAVRIVPGEARCKVLGADPGTPLGLPGGQVDLDAGRRPPPRVVAVLGELGQGRVERERRRPLGVRRGEEQTQRPAVRDAEEGRLLRVDGVHHGTHVVHPLLEGWHALHRVRKPGAALVEDDQARERGELLEEARDRRVLPVPLEMTEEARHVHEVDRPLAQHLIGDARVAATGIPRLAHHASENVLERAVPEPLLGTPRHSIPRQGRLAKPG